jgi:hypothetical protein
MVLSWLNPKRISKKLTTRLNNHKFTAGVVYYKSMKRKSKVKPIWVSPQSWSCKKSGSASRWHKWYRTRRYVASHPLGLNLGLFSFFFLFLPGRITSRQDLIEAYLSRIYRGSEHAPRKNSSFPAGGMGFTHPYSRSFIILSAHLWISKVWLFVFMFVRRIRNIICA